MLYINYTLRNHMISFFFFLAFNLIRSVIQRNVNLEL